MKKRPIPAPIQANSHSGGEDYEGEDDIQLAASPRKRSIVYKNFRETFSCFSFAIFVWMCILTLLILYHVVFGGFSSAAAARNGLVPVIEAKKDQSRYDVPFTLVPDESSKGRVMTLTLKQMVFERLVRYDVCCFQQSYFLCRSTTKNLGVECLMTKDKTALINVIHPDMVGARCTLMWSEKN